MPSPQLPSPLPAPPRSNRFPAITLPKGCRALPVQPFFVGSDIQCWLVLEPT